MEQKNISKEASFIIGLSEKASKIIREAYNPIGLPFNTKEDRSPVTEHDIAVNKMIIEEVKENYPEWGVLGEELQWNTESKTLLVVDPIDGTRPFTYGVPIFGFLAALVEDGSPKIGVMNNPIAGRTLWAEKGFGAYHLESQSKLSVNPSEKINGQICNVNSSSTVSAHMRKQIKLAGSKAMSMYSAMESASLVALGHTVGDFLALKTPHDVAATKIIIEEAGGKVTDLEGRDQRYDKEINGAIISNGKVHDELLSIYKQAILDDKADPAYES